MRRILFMGLAVMVLSVTSQAQAQILFSDDFDDAGAAGRWSAPVIGLETPAIGSDGNVDYAFDYSAISNPFDGGNPIPPAPNSAGTTIGVYMTSNNTDNCPSDPNCGGSSDEGDSIGIVSNFDLPAVGNYKVTADLFLFWNGGGGSTEYTSFGINHQRSNNAPLRFGLNNGDGLAWQVDTDGDSHTDILRYKGPGGETALGGWEDIPNGTIPGVPTGDATIPGIFSQWVEVEITNANGESGFRINGVLIDQTNNPFSGGGVLIGHSDAFNSVNNAINGFTSGSIWDNIVVEAIPEPASALLLLLGIAGLSVRHRA